MSLDAVELAGPSSFAARAAMPSRSELIRPLHCSVIASICLMAASLTACDSVNQAVAQAKTSTAAVFSPSASGAGRGDAPSAPGIAGSDLADLFKRYPLGGPQSHDNYPRVAITIVSATPSILRLGGKSADQCIRYDVRLWVDAKTPRSFSGLQMCAKDQSYGIPFRTVQFWQGKYVTWEATTGASRTDGPRRPKTNFPTEARVANVWFDSSFQGIFFIGSLLYQMGYDWDQPGEHRVWFVSAPNA